LDQWQEELHKRGDRCEGTAIDPVTAALSGKGGDMEGYLGRLFNHGAVLVNRYDGALVTPAIRSEKLPTAKSHLQLTANS
jgi:hypothetical protein